MSVMSCSRGDLMLGVRILKIGVFGVDRILAWILGRVRLCLRLEKIGKAVLKGCNYYYIPFLPM